MKRERESYAGLFALDFYRGSRLETGVLLRYLRQLDTPRRILWCYAIWYGFILVRYFDPTPALWLTALGLSAIIGFALLLSTRVSVGTAKLPFWGIARLFLMPFCVSSFAALVKGRGFLLIFPPRWGEAAIGLSCCAVFWLFVTFLKRLGAANPSGTISPGN